MALPDPRLLEFAKRSYIICAGAINSPRTPRALGNRRAGLASAFGYQCRSWQPTHTSARISKITSSQDFTFEARDDVESLDAVAAAMPFWNNEGLRIDRRFFSHSLDLKVLARQVRFMEDIISRAELLTRYLKPYTKRFTDLEVT
ncbi:hypothetical protein DSL72_003147 [Monilinia vaccinii-corymbosi]|uniref:Uncharacterized protein n=1 Tax=Monilinia vaccinii-corymbosi TaxID=61207 RepID=A0A8A3P5D3_9HELO|nr:hypothetical protein DSL72_003147 [Monilinia vaccinii-corymbosi]